MLKRVILDIEPFDGYEIPQDAICHNIVNTPDGERIAIYYESTDEETE
jgi:hypothetical protein